MISERLIKEETLEGPLFESLFNQPIDEEGFEGPSVIAGMPINEEQQQRSLPSPNGSYPISSQLPSPSYKDTDE
jgi:cell division protease FtsH